MKVSLRKWHRWWVISSEEVAIYLLAHVPSCFGTSLNHNKCNKKRKLKNNGKVNKIKVLLMREILTLKARK